MCPRKPTQHQILSYIEDANDWQISEIIHTTVHRFNQLFPDWDVSFLSLPKNDPAERERMLQAILQLHKNP